MVEAETSFKGLQNLYANNITEYPDTINVLERFNVYPELFLGLTYRFLGIFHLNAIYIQQKLSFLDYAWHASFSKIAKKIKNFCEIFEKNLNIKQSYFKTNV